MSSELRRSYQLDTAKFRPSNKTLQPNPPDASKRTANLKERDAKILAHLCEHPTATTKELSAAAWREAHTNYKQLVYNAIGRLRNHFDEVGLSRKALTNNRNEGYTLTITPEPVDEPELPTSNLPEELTHTELAQRCRAHANDGTIEPTGARITEDQNPVDLISEHDGHLYDDLLHISCTFLLRPRIGGSIAGRIVTSVINGFLKHTASKASEPFENQPELLKAFANLRIIFVPRGNTDPVYVLNEYNPRLGEVFTCRTGTTATRTHRYQDAAAFATKLRDGLPDDKDLIIQFVPEIQSQENDVRRAIATVFSHQPWAEQAPALIEVLFGRKQPERKAPRSTGQAIPNHGIRPPTVHERRTKKKLQG